jgi:hypothetical protein
VGKHQIKAERQPRPRWRWRWRRRPSVALAFAVFAVLAAVILASVLNVAGMLSAGAGSSTGGSCARTVRVVTASSFTPVLDAIRSSLASDRNCVALQVTTADGREAPARVASHHADVWIPDDASWAGVATEAKLATHDAGSGTVLATSPIYLVAHTAIADRLTQTANTWLAMADLLGSPDPGMRLVVRDPAESGDGLVPAGALGEAEWLAHGMDRSALVLSDVVKVTRTVRGAEAIPAAADEVGLVPEYALRTGLEGLGPDTRLLAPTDYTAMLRYTWFATSDAAKDPERSRALKRLLDELRGSMGGRAIDAAGLRLPGGDAPSGFAPDRLPALAASPFAVYVPHHVEHVFTTFYREDRRVSLVVVVDVSASMNTTAPGSQAPLLDLVRQGCGTVAGLLPNDAYFGLWEFGISLDPPNHHKILAPNAALDAGQRANVANALGQLQANSPGTALYATILAAYASARDNYRPGLPNQVLIFTDGEENIRNSMGLTELGSLIGAAKDDTRPVQLSVVMFGGSAASATALRSTLAPVNGYVSTPASAQDVAALFIHVAAGGLRNT